MSDKKGGGRGSGKAGRTSGKSSPVKHKGVPCPSPRHADISERSKNTIRDTLKPPPKK